MRNKINQYDTEDKEHGLWEGYRANGQISYKGEFIHGFQHGPWIGYRPDDGVWFKETYDMGKVINYYAIYDCDGLIKIKRFYAN